MKRMAVIAVGLGLIGSAALLQAELAGLVALGLALLAPDPYGALFAQWLARTFPLSILACALSALLAWWGRHTAVEPPRSYGTRIGAFVGCGVVLGALLVCSVLFAQLGTNPLVQAMVRASEPHPEARLPITLIPLLAGGIGALIGLVLGAYSFVAALLGGLLVDLLTHDQAPQTTSSVLR